MFKVGDEVSVKGEITKVCESGVVVKAHYFGEAYFDRSNMDVIGKTYEQGLADAWELVRKIKTMGCLEFEKLFGCACLSDVLCNFTAEEALAKIEAYEKEKEIKVGDVVESKDTQRRFLVVTEEDDDSVYEFGVIDLKTLTLDRICNYPKGFTKTGKHIDIESLLRQIGE